MISANNELSPFPIALILEEAVMADNRNMDFSQMQTGFPQMQGTPVAAAAAQYYPATPQAAAAAAAQYGMIPPGMIAPAPMMAQGIYPVQSTETEELSYSDSAEEGAYIAAPMAMLAAGNMPPPPPYTPQMAQSAHAPKGGFPMAIGQGVMPGMVPGQIMSGMQASARPPDDQKKGRHFHEQQMKLKLLGTMGMTSTDPDRMIESMFGKMSKAKPKPTTTTNTTAIDSDPDSFGDFMQGPSTSDSTSSEKPGSGDNKPSENKGKKSISKTTTREASTSDSSTVTSDSTTSSSSCNKTVRSTNSEKKKKSEKKDLMAMMLQYSDLKVSKKPKTFQKKTLRDVNPMPTLTTKTTSYTTSERSRKWEDVDDTLSGLFKAEEQNQLQIQDCMCSHQSQQSAGTPDSGNTTPSISQYPNGPFQTLPAWCYMDDDQLPQVYRQVYEASSANDCILTDRLYPILLLSGLPRQTLREIWEVCNMTTPGQLIKPEMYFMLTLIAIAQNNQGVPSIEILNQLHSAPVPYFSQAATNPVTTPGPPSNCPTPSAVPSTHLIVSPRPSLPQEMTPACSGIPQPSVPSTNLPMGPIQYAAPPHPTLETTFGLTPTPHLNSSSFNNTLSFNGFSKENANKVTPSSDIYGDDDFADFQAAPKITSETSESQNKSSAIGTDLATDSKCAMNVSKPEFETLPELSAEDKYSNVRNFFCSDDSSVTAHQCTFSPEKGTSTNSFDDDDYDDFKSADSKPSDDTSQFSTSEQSEGEDFKALDLYVDDFKSGRNLSQITSPNVSSTLNPFQIGELNSPNDHPSKTLPSPTSTPPPPPLPGQPPQPFSATPPPLAPREMVPPVLNKPPGESNVVGRRTSSDPRTMSSTSTKAVRTEGFTEYKSADLKAVEDEYSDFKAAPVIPSMKEEIERATSQSDRYAAFRELQQSAQVDDPSKFEQYNSSSSSSSSSGGQENDSRPSSEAKDWLERNDSNENWADFQSASKRAGHDLAKRAPPSYDIAVKNSSLASEAQPIDDDDSGWADFQTSSSCMDNWADFNQGSFNSLNMRKENVQSGAGKSSSSLAEQKYSVDSESSSFDLDSTHSASSTTSSSLVTIVKDNLQKKEILSLFKVRDDLSQIHSSHSGLSDIATGTSGDGSGEHRVQEQQFDLKRVKSKHSKHDLNNPPTTSATLTTILSQSCQKQQQGFKKVTTPVTASNVSLDLSSPHMDIYQEPPPLDDQIEAEDEFGGFSHEIDDFDELSDRANFPNPSHHINVRPSLGLSITPRGRTTETITVDGQSSLPTSQSGNFDFGDEDSHSSKDTDSLSWQDRAKFQKEDSQSVSSLELSYNSAGRGPAQRDSDLAADSQSVSSSEFPAFETLQKQETTLESKSLDSLEFRNDEPAWGEICDNTGETVFEDNKNRNAQNLTAETISSPLPTSASAPTQPLSNLSKNISSGNGGHLIARDRYSSVIEDVQGSDRHCHEWTKCLDKCYQKIKEANNVFNSISTSSVCNEVIKSCQGADYIMAIIEIYRVVCKITVTMRMSALTNEQLETLLKDIDLAWNNLAAFLSGSSLMAEVSSFNYTSAVLKTDDTASQLKACGICLLNVDVMDRASNDNERTAKLTYSGRQYHATCANFWVNCVDSMLPALKLPQLI